MWNFDFLLKVGCGSTRLRSWDEAVDSHVRDKGKIGRDDGGLVSISGRKGIGNCQPRIGFGDAIF